MCEHEIFLSVACSRNLRLDYDWYCLGNSNLTLRYLFHSSYSECRCTVSIEASLREFSLRSHDDFNVQQYRGIQILYFISRIGQSVGDITGTKTTNFEKRKAENRSSRL